jgi:hypothetical protein
VLAPVRSYLMPRPRRHCTPMWDCAAAWSVPSESS